MAAQGSKVPVTPENPPVEQVQRYLTGGILFWHETTVEAWKISRGSVEAAASAKW